MQEAMPTGGSMAAVMPIDERAAVAVCKQASDETSAVCEVASD